MKVAFCALGCKVNQYEIDCYARLFKEKGYEIGCVGDFRYSVFKEKKKQVDEFNEISKNLFITPSELEKQGVNIKKDGIKRSCFNVMSYNDVSHETILKIWPELKNISYDVYEQVEIEAKYSGYIKRQLADIDVFKKD